MQVKKTTELLIAAFRANKKGDAAVVAAQGRKVDAMRKAMDELIDAWTNANVPRTKEGIALITKDIAEARKEAETRVAGYSHKTLADYISGAKRCYVARMKWKADAHLRFEKSGVPDLPWKRTVKRSAAKKPGKVTNVSPETLNQELTRVLAAIRQLKGADAADAVLDVLVTKCGFRVAPPTSTRPAAKKPAAKKPAAKKAAK